MVSFGYLREKCYLCSDIYKIAKDMENLHKNKISDCQANERD